MIKKLILIFIVLAILFLMVVWNMKNNRKKFYDRESRDFRRNLQEKINEKKSQNEDKNHQ